LDSRVPKFKPPRETVLLPTGGKKSTEFLIVEERVFHFLEKVLLL